MLRTTTRRSLRGLAGAYAATVMLLMSGCGGGGDSGSGSTPQSAAPSAPTGSNGTPDPGTTNPTPTGSSGQPSAGSSTGSDPASTGGQPAPPSLPSLALDEATQSYFSRLTTREQDSIPQRASVRLNLQSATSAPSAIGSIKVVEGVVSNSFFVADLVLPEMDNAFIRSSRTLNGFTVDWYRTLAQAESDPVYVVSAAAQLLTSHGVRSVGMGQWQASGPDQTSLVPGKKLAGGSFLFGTPTPLDMADTLATGTYDGLSHSLLQSEFSASYYDSFLPLTAKVVATYDRTTRTLSLQLTDFVLWSGGLRTQVDSALQQIAPSATFDADMLPGTLSCTTVLPAGSVGFTCDIDQGGRRGTVKGKFFGADGAELAGTFLIVGRFRWISRDVAIGAFVTRRR